MVDTNDAAAQPNHYLQHLTELNDSQEVTASEDIYNQFGVLLIAKGSRINRQSQKQLNQHPLKKSLDQQIALKTTFSDKQVFQQGLLMLERAPELWRLHQNNHFEDPFRHICLSENLPLQIRQKLSVMSQQLPKLFEHCLFTGWAAALIAKEMGLKPNACREAYICGLLHDIGLLHISADVQTQTPLSEENWRALQSHVVIGQRCADECGLSKSIGRGILEHHERLDRTGYPTRKEPEKLGLLGQVISGADLLHSMCTNELSESKSSVHDAVPYFKIHRGSFNQAIHTAMMRILARSTPDSEASLQPVNLQRVRQINQLIKSLLSPLTELNQQTLNCDQSECTSIAAMMASIIDVLSVSGLNDDQLSEWLMSELDQSDSSSQIDLKEIDAMQYELLWLFKRLGWNIKSLLDSANAQASQATPALSQYHQLLIEQLEHAFGCYTQTAEPAEPSEPESDIVDLSATEPTTD
ncbi:MAG: HD domain-containing phosphohydrolase [Halopseudomonas sp.]